MNRDADTGRSENKFPELDVCTDEPEPAASSIFEQVRRAEAVLAFLR